MSKQPDLKTIIDIQAHSGETLLDVQDIVKSFGGWRAVDHCSLSVRRGTITGLIGLSHAAKKTSYANASLAASSGVKPL